MSEESLRFLHELFTIFRNLHQRNLTSCRNFTALFKIRCLGTATNCSVHRGQTAQNFDKEKLNSKIRGTGTATKVRNSCSATCGNGTPTKSSQILRNLLVQRQTHDLNVLFPNHRYWHNNRCDKLLLPYQVWKGSHVLFKTPFRNSLMQIEDIIASFPYAWNAESVPAIQNFPRRQVTLGLSRLPASKHRYSAQSLASVQKRRHGSNARCQIRSWLEIMGTSIMCSTTCGTETSTFCSQNLTEICFCGTLGNRRSVPRCASHGFLHHLRN